MSPEKKFLTDIVKKLDCQKKPLLRKLWFRSLFWLVTFTVLIGSAFIDNEFLDSFVELFIGFIIGMYVMLQVGATNWPFLESHIDLESVNNRINEIDT